MRVGVFLINDNCWCPCRWTINRKVCLDGYVPNWKVLLEVLVIKVAIIVVVVVVVGVVILDDVGIACHRVVVINVIVCLPR